MKPCFINKKDEVFGDQNTFRIWRRWGSGAIHNSYSFEIQAGWFYSFAPDKHLPHWLFTKRDIGDLEDFLGETPGGYERMIRIDMRETEDMVITMLLDELNDI